ncbi:glycosyltransferase [Streptomyces sp. HUAS MG91]|uniref:4,4'-diaponeurosporenoate glycosyltransferase n=1 Tax=Streptomyces tabacisoli TaxID=3156398 RepID=A0AAU8IKU5_9ACTN
MNPAAVAVVIPAHNEQSGIAACLRSVRRAARAVPLPVVTVVVADACEDATAAIASAQGVIVVPSDAHNVGVARARGVDRALDLLPGPDTWLAMTDADTLVPGDWLSHQITWARHHYDAVLGTIRLIRSAGPRTVAELHDRDYFRTRPVQTRLPWTHPHVHGANLGVSAAAYARVGGFRPYASGEDRDLAARLAATGHRIARSGQCVYTSSRLRGRAPGGLADLLAALASAQAG